MKVYLIGYRACGKTTVGEKLAEKLNYPFLDADSLLEESLGMPIKDIVAAHGWDYFRAQEKETMCKLARKRSCVIATGGGVVLDSDNVDLMKKTGTVIWLGASVHDIIQRLKKDAKTGTQRPRFTERSLVQETMDMLRQRIPLYQKAADYAPDTADKTVMEIAEDIYHYLMKTGFPGKINKNKNHKNLRTGE